MFDTTAVAGLGIFSAGPDALVDVVLEAVRSKRPLPVHFISANSVWMAESDPEFRSLLESGGVLAPDSRWLEISSRLTGPGATQTRGPDMFSRILGGPQFASVRHIFIGPSEEVNAALAQVIVQRFPDLDVTSYQVAPFAPFSDDDVEALADVIRTEKASVVWLGIGTPAQDVLAVKLASRTNTVVMAVGAAFEFLAGLKPEAPQVLSRWGLEWLYRLVTEPRRLWRRYLIGNTVFLYAVIKYWLFPGRPAGTP